jgi:GNAT superfamily N-acetyltransferase
MNNDNRVGCHPERINIRRATEKDADGLVAFMINFRRELYPMLDPNILPQDIVQFKASYIQAPQSAVYIAENENKELIGCIAMRAYDHRFDSMFAMTEYPAVEVQKLFVIPSMRRKGVASLLFNQLLETAKLAGIKALYLHTHPFLSGAEEFWKFCDFQVILRENLPVFFTIHMNRTL